MSFSLCQLSVPRTPSFQPPPSLQSTQIRLTGSGPHLLGLVTAMQWLEPSEAQRRKPQIFTKQPGPAVSYQYLPQTFAQPPRAQCTQNYHDLTQAGAHGEESHRGRRTRGLRRHRGHSEAEVARVYSFSRGRLKYNFQEDCIMDYCLRKLWQRTIENLSFPKGAFPPQGLREAGGERRLLLVFCSRLGMS